MSQRLKKIFALVLAFALTGCGGEDDGQQKYPYALGTSSTEDTVTHIYAQSFVDEVTRLSDGRIKIQVYPNSVLGGDRELLESCADGDIPFIVQNTAPQVSFMSEMAVFDIPFVFQDIQTLRQTVDDTAFYSKIQGIYESYNYKLLGFADEGFRNMTSNHKIDTLSDFSGMKIRIMENINHIAFWKAIGTNPTPMAFSEVYIGLQQKTIDAMEGTYEVIYSAKIHEQQNYIIETNHLPHLISFVVNQEFFEAFPPEDQALLLEAAENAKAIAREAADYRSDEKKVLIEEIGTQVLPLPAEVLEEVKAQVAPVQDSIRKQAGDDLVDLYLQYTQSE